MSVSIIGCPSCKTLVLSDTIQCPTCGHVFDEVRLKRLTEEPEQEGIVGSDDEEVPCQNCHEKVRAGLVRCWNCGHFMRDDIAKMYEEMQSTQRPVIYSPLPEIDEEDFVASDADFDIPSEQGDDEDFEYNPDPSPMTSHEPTDYYRLQKPAAANASAQQMGYAPQQQPAYPQQPSAETNGAYPPQTAPQQSPAPHQPTPQQPVAEATPPTPAQAPANPPAPEAEKAHSQETGGEVLLNIAMQEEKESKTRRKQRKSSPRSRDGFIVYCPNGHRVEVKDRHRGMTGRCPRCRAAFFVPLTTHDEPKPPEAQAGEQPPEGAVAEAAPKSSPWLKDVALHRVDPGKLKLKPNSLANTFELVDICFVPEGMLIVWLVKSGGLFSSGGDKKKEATRETLATELSEGKKVEELSAPQKLLVPADKLREQAKVVQPYPYPHESIFAGVPVFGDGKIAVRIPSFEEKPLEQIYLSMFLSRFRQLSEQFATHYGIQHFGEDCGVPLTDEFTEMVCHYSEWKLPVLQHVEFYQPDSEFKLKEIGWQCEGCQLVISEESRKKEKIGGKTSKGIAKAKCPKCQSKFGHHPLLTLEEVPVGETAATST